MTERKFYADIDVDGSLSANSIKYKNDSNILTPVTGETYWDSTQQCLVTNVGNKSLAHGEEMWVPLCYNDSGATINDGDPVYINSSVGGYPTIRKASSKTYETSRLVGVATETITNGSYGRITRFGFVNGISLLTFSAGDVAYLGDGILTPVVPLDGDYPIVVGKVIVGGSSGKLLVYPQTSQYTSEINKVSGFSSYLEGEETNLSFTNGTRTFSITPVSSSFYYYHYGKKYVKNGVQTFQISNVEGFHLIYYDGDTLYESVNPTINEVYQIYYDKVPVTAVYWDATNSQHIYLANNKHTFEWPSSLLAHDRIILGISHISGHDPLNIVTGNGTLNAHAQFGVDAGTIVSQDIFTTSTVISSTTGLPIFYRLGANGYWRRTTRAGFSFLNDGTTGLMQYNQYTGTEWILASMSNLYYSFVHVFALNNTTTDKVVAMMGTQQYNTVSNAESGVYDEISEIVNSSYPYLAGYKHLYSIIFNTRSNYSNSVKANITQTTNGDDFIDFRKSALISNGGGSGAGSTSFLGLTDTPTSYGGQANSLVQVTTDEIGLKFSAQNTLNLSGFNNDMDVTDFGFSGDTNANYYVHPTGFSNQPASALTNASVISRINISGEGHVTGVTTRNLTLANLGYTGAVDANKYIHPSGFTHQPSVALTGANVISQINVNNEGHVTGATSRTLTLLNLGYSGATNANYYVHPSGFNNQPSVALTNASVISQVGVNDEGHVTGITSRTLTLANLGYTGDTDANKYIHPTGFTDQPATALTGSNVISKINVNNEGHITGVTSRSLSLANLGYTGAADADKYSSWNFQSQNSAGTQIGIQSIGSGQTATIKEGSNITLSQSSGVITINSQHPSVSSASSSNNGGRTYIQDVLVDSYGHITGITTATETVVDTNTTSLPIENSLGTVQFTATDTTGLQFQSSGATTIAFDAANQRIIINSVNDTYTQGNAIVINGNEISHADTSSSTGISSSSSGNTFIQGLTLGVDTYGHVTGASVATATASFTDTNWYPTGYSWTNGTTAGATGSLTGVGMSAVSFPAIPSASATISGIVTTGNQTFAGAKTFSGITEISNTTESTTTGNGALIVDGGIGIAKNLNVGGNLTLTGNLVVHGSTTTVNSNTVTIDDPIFTLGGDTTPTVNDAKDRGIEFRWHNGTTSKLGFFGYDDSTGKFTFIPDGTNTSEVFSGIKGEIDANLNWDNLIGTTPSPSVTITLTGDVTGTVNSTIANLTGGTFTLGTTIAANSVALGTDTTGNYAASVSGGTGITVTGTAGEGTVFGVAHSDTSTLSGAYGTNGIKSITVDGLGHITAVTTETYLTGTKVDSFSAGTTGLSPSGASTGAVVLSGVLNVANGGTGQSTYANGEILIGNGSGLTKTTLTQGGAITITNGAGSIQIAHTDTSSSTGISSNSSGNTFIQDLTLGVDTYGHVTGASVATATASFTDTNYYPTGFSWTNGGANGPTGSLTGVGMSAVSFPAIPSASATISGIVTTGNQTFAGTKTFNNTISGSIDGSAAKLGTSNVGNTSTPIYLNAGSPSALTATVGGTANPTYLNNGAITAISATVGSTTLPVYMNSGTITVCSGTLGVSITGSSASATNATNSTNIGITNNTTSNANYYPVWVTATSGNAPAYVTNTKLYFNPSTGMLNANTFNALSTTDGGFQGIATDTASVPSFTWTGNLNTGMFRPDTNIIGFTTNAAERVRINATGDVLIGTTTVSEKLTVNGNIAFGTNGSACKIVHNTTTNSIDFIIV